MASGAEASLPTPRPARALRRADQPFIEKGWLGSAIPGIGQIA